MANRAVFNNNGFRAEAYIAEGRGSNLVAFRHNSSWPLFHDVNSYNPDEVYFVTGIGITCPVLPILIDNAVILLRPFEGVKVSKGIQDDIDPDYYLKLRQTEAALKPQTVIKTHSYEHVSMLKHGNRRYMSASQTYVIQTDSMVDSVALAVNHLIPITSTFETKAIEVLKFLESTGILGMYIGNDYVENSAALYMDSNLLPLSEVL